MRSKYPPHSPKITCRAIYSRTWDISGNPELAHLKFQGFIQDRVLERYNITLVRRQVKLGAKHFKHENFSSNILYHKLNFLLINPHADKMFSRSHFWADFVEIQIHYK
jgi:hypothetical protein